VTLALVVGIGLIGGVGAIARFLLDGAVSRRVDGAFPYGTFAVNLLGAFLLGLLVGAAVEQNAYKLAGTGLLGAFTTFSTWAFESHRLGEDRELDIGVVNFAVSLALGLAAAAAGRKLGAVL
jgi:fluoride exporter